jgi:outer membrane protein assembly factor BamB
LYVTPHPCACYINAKLTGFNALAARGDGDLPADRADGPRLRKGPAYGDVAVAPDSSSAARDSWPTYRHDPRRSGGTESAVDADLSVRWQVGLCVKPSSVTVAGGKAFVADVDSHTVYAIGTDDGQTVWTFAAAARVDSPPTIYKGMAIFGSADGRVYCLRAEDGALVWQFDAAPRRRLVAAFGQLESAWPVPGSVLVQDGTCWFAAGRSSYLDGGIRLYALEPATGRVLSCETVYDPDPDTGRMTPEPSAQTMAGLLNDIPVSDGANVFVRQRQIGSSDARRDVYVATSGGYLDSSWFNRTFWQAGRAKTSGLMVLGEDVAYGLELYESRSRETVFRPGASVYRLRCIPLTTPDSKQAAGRRRRQEPSARWEQHLGIRVSAMVRAADTIFVAGSPDIVDPDDPDGAWKGRMGGVLAAFSAADGNKLMEEKLPAPPVWDGMAAADGRLHISLLDGWVLCLGTAEK